jgi:hypothetical protein
VDVIREVFNDGPNRSNDGRFQNGDSCSCGISFFDHPTREENTSSPTATKAEEQRSSDVDLGVSFSVTIQ